jgi:hypothetical protein
MQAGVCYNIFMEKKFFEGRTLVIATMHGKERVIAPILEKELGVRAILPENFNTDIYGTFTRDIKRKGDQLEAARRKAHKALELTGLDLVVASEGSFGVDPQIPFIQTNLELLVLIDTKNSIEIHATHRTSATNVQGRYIEDIPQLLEFARACDFPNSGLILRYSKNGKFGIYKNIHTVEELEAKAKKMLQTLFVRKIFVETDMRAHRNPLRMNAIQEATKELITEIEQYNKSL